VTLATSLSSRSPSRRTIALRRIRWTISRCYSPALGTSVGLFCVVFIGLVITVAVASRQAFAHSGIAFLWSTTWNPAANSYGAGLLVVGTIVTTLVALAIVVPVGIGAAIALAEIAPPWIATPISAVIELLAALPSIVVGLWGLLVLSPVFARDVEPFLRSIPVIGWFFHGLAYGPSILLASVVLAVMTLPTMVALSRTSITAVPTADREAALALGATRWQVTRRAVLPGARSGIEAAITLATGRALGESIAVAMVIGNDPSLPRSLIAPGATLGSAIINEFAESSPGLGTSSIIALALVLLILSLVVNLGGRAFIRARRAARNGSIATRGAEY
jgi:phosphate transport system permease protein